jgi:quinol monooxygenase YgiN
MGFHSYIVAAGFHTRVDAIEAMKQVVAQVTAPSLDEEGCQIYHWSQGADDPTLFLLYMEWRDKACFEAQTSADDFESETADGYARIMQDKSPLSTSTEEMFSPPLMITSFRLVAN